MEKYYKIAGLTIKMDTFGRTLAQAEPYECPPCEPVDAVVAPDKVKWKGLYPDVDDDLREYMATGSNFYVQLVLHEGMQLHSSAVVVDNKAYLFTAASGTGKSTHTSLWLEKFGDRAYILNDDKPALRLEDGVWYAYGTPWSGKHDLNRNARVPLAGIAVLVRGEENSCEPITGIEAIREVLQRIHRPKYMEHRTRLMGLMDKLITQIPIWKLTCNMEPEAAEVAYRAMSAVEAKK